MNHRIHFVYDDTKKEDADCARRLIADLGQTDISESFNVVSIGGDGTLLRALNKGAGKKILGLTMNVSSKGFWTNRLDDVSAENILRLLNEGTGYPISPLKAEIHFADGSGTIRHAFNDVVLRPAQQFVQDELRNSLGIPSTDISLQSLLINLSVSHAGEVMGSKRIMGSGLIFATAFGSTAINHVYNGPSLDIRTNGIVLTGMGIKEPEKGFNSVVCDGAAHFRIKLLSPNKRPAMMSYDSFGIAYNENGSPIDYISLSLDNNAKTHLILADSPGTRAFTALNLDL